MLKCNFAYLQEMLVAKVIRQLACVPLKPIPQCPGNNLLLCCIPVVCHRRPKARSGPNCSGGPFSSSSASLRRIAWSKHVRSVTVHPPTRRQLDCPRVNNTRWIILSFAVVFYQLRVAILDSPLNSDEHVMSLYHCKYTI